MDQHVDVVVVGAGIQGLAVAKTFLSCEPDINLLVLDSNLSIGGTWSKESLYPGLRSNNLLGTFEYTDFPMHEGYGVEKEQHIPGTVIHGYLCDFVKHFDLMKHIRLCTKVVSAEEVDGNWVLKIVSWQPSPNENSKASEYTITCDKLVMATGLTCAPVQMSIPGSSTFMRPIVNFSKLASAAPELLKDPSVQHITIYGGSKSAHDCVYLFASAGKRITWIIRESGHGPTYMAPGHIYLGPFRCWLEALAATRWLTWMSPCIWGDADGFGWIRRLIHRSSWGPRIVETFWNKLTSDLVSQSGLNTHEKLKTLIPNGSAFWMATGLGVLNYPTDIHDLVISGQVEVVRKDITGLEGESGVKFSDGRLVQTDVFVASTGWKFTPGVNLLPEVKLAGWGVPSTKYTPEQMGMWDDLNQEADVEILERFPLLASGPQVAENYMLVNPADIVPAAEKPRKREEYTPWRLWRGMAPPSQVTSGKRNLVFLGMVSNIQKMIKTEISSLWAYAYLNNQLEDSVMALSATDGHAPTLNLEQHVMNGHSNKNPNGSANGNRNSHAKGVSTAADEVMYDTALFSRFGRWRCPRGQGARLPDFVFDGIPYFDLILGDLGMSGWRKGWGWFGEVFGGAYGPKEYNGVTSEWLAKKKRT